MKARTRARAVALQALYEIDMVDHPPLLVISDRFSDNELDPKMEEFVSQITLGVWPIVEYLDAFIAEHAQEWPLDQVAIVDRNILRIALWEFAVSENIPIKVAINEAVELAKVFGSDSTPRFINGVLGSLASRQNEIRQSLRRLHDPT